MEPVQLCELNSTAATMSGESSVEILGDSYVVVARSLALQHIDLVEAVAEPWEVLGQIGSAPLHAAVGTCQEGLFG